MNKNILKKYYEMQNKVILPEDNDCNNKELAASVAANLASIGFPMSSEMTKKLAKANKDDILNFYKVNYELLSDVIGAGKKPKPFYPDFPEGCMKRSEAEYFIDQIIYGLSGLECEPVKYMKEKKRFPFLGTPMHRVLMEGSLEDLNKTFGLAVMSTIAYSKEQRAFIMEYVQDVPSGLKVLVDNTQTKNRENAVTCAMMIEDITGNDMHTRKFMKQPTDLLRYAAFKSARKNGREDPYNAIALRDYKSKMPSFAVGRRERTFIMDCLASMDNGNAEKLSSYMHGHDEEWNRLFAKLHITDKAWAKPKYKNVKDAIVIIQSGKSIDRPARRIEEAVKANNVEKSVNECTKAPGEFMRRFDKLYRMSIEQNKENLVLESLKSVAEKAGIATVTGVIGSIETRNKDEEIRYFKNKQKKVYSTTEKNRKAFTDKQIEAVKDVAMGSLVNRFAGKEYMGSVFISESLKDVKVPADIRDNSGAVGNMTSGSKMPITKTWNTMRFFTMWTNINKDYEGRVDIDLSVTFCDKNMNIVDFCGWNGKRNGEGFVYSGDVQDGGAASGEGRAEYVDIDLSELKTRNIKYVIPQINSYTMQEFSKQPNTSFGVMHIEPEDMGQIFEPSTVVNRFVLDNEATQSSPYVIDIEEMEILWMNDSAQNQVASAGLISTLRKFAMTQGSKVMSLLPLVEANVLANGQKTDNPKKADLIFVGTIHEMEELKKEYGIDDDAKFILPNNMEYIVGYLMADSQK